MRKSGSPESRLGGAAQAEGSVWRTLPGVLTGHTAELLESTVPLVLFSVFLKILNGRSWFFVVLDTPKRMLGTLAAECVTGNVQNPDRTGLTGQSHLLPRGTSRAHVHPRFPARLSRAVTHLHVLILLRNFYQLPVERASNCSRRRTERPRLCQEPALSSAEETGQGGDGRQWVSLPSPGFSVGRKMRCPEILRRGRWGGGAVAESVPWGQGRTFSPKTGRAGKARSLRAVALACLAG